MLNGFYRIDRRVWSVRVFRSAVMATSGTF